MVAFQVQWFASILGAARDMAWVGLAFGVGWMCVHVSLLDGQRRRELATIGFALLFGLTAETVLASTGLLRMRGGPDFAGLTLPPTWLPVLWAGLGATINHSLGWLRRRYALAVTLGAIAGPFAYASAQLLGAVQIDGTMGLVGVGLAYAIATPAMLAVAHFFDHQPRPLQAGAAS